VTGFVKKVTLFVNLKILVDRLVSDGVWKNMMYYPATASRPPTPHIIGYPIHISSETGEAEALRGLNQ